MFCCPSHHMMAQKGAQLEHDGTAYIKPCPDLFAVLCSRSVTGTSIRGHLAIPTKSQVLSELMYDDSTCVIPPGTCVV